MRKQKKEGIAVIEDFDTFRSSCCLHNACAKRSLPWRHIVRVGLIAVDTK